MKLGMVCQPSYAPELDGASADLLTGLLGDAVRAEELGFDSVWATEHHFQGYGGIIPSPAVFLAAASQRTARVRLGVCVALLPLHDPLHTAEQWAMVDALSGGRLEFGIGRGSLRWPYHNFGVDFEQSRARAAESLEVVLRAWTAGEVTFRGAHFGYDGVAVL